jgi:hypothetical protein
VKPGISRMDKIVAFDETRSVDDFMALPNANGPERQARTEP